MASRFVVDVQSVLSREKDPFQFGVFSIGAIEGGSAPNVIPDSVTMRGTIRSYDPNVREKMQAGIRRTAQGVATMAGAPEPELSITPGGDAIVNDKAIVGRTESVFQSVFGAAKVHRVPPITASEDFSEFVNAGVPSMFFFVGVYDPKDIAASRAPGGKPMPFNHSPMFAPVAEPSLKTSIKAMSFAVLGALQR
jgi:hippurate hydrolase